MQPIHREDTRMTISRYSKKHQKVEPKEQPREETPKQGVSYRARPQQREWRRFKYRGRWFESRLKGDQVRLQALDDDGETPLLEVYVPSNRVYDAYKKLATIIITEKELERLQAGGD